MGFFTISILGLVFIFLMTMIGYIFALLMKSNSNEKYKKFILGFASGVMIAASIWSLIIPAIEKSEKYKNFKVIPVGIGFFLGCAFIYILDLIVKSRMNSKENNKEKRIIKLFTAITLHNIPEGMAVGLCFGLAIIYKEHIYLVSGMLLSLGIGIQNIPEGMALSLAIKEEVGKKKTTLLLSFISAVVEPVFGFVALIFAVQLSSIMPYALSFAAGTMMYVVVDELIPESKSDDNSFGTWGIMVGFIIMMVLDIVV